MEVHPRRVGAAPFARRLGASLLDNAAALLLFYPSSLFLSVFENPAPGFVACYVALNQLFVLAWTLCRDAWWPGQGLGKRIAAVLIVEARSDNPASRLRCIWRQTICAFIVLSLYLPIYLYLFRSPQIIPQAVISSLLSVAIPVRLPLFLAPGQLEAAGEMIVAHMLVLGFILLEALLAFRRPGGRRIIDFLAGTRVVDVKAKRTPAT